LAALNRINEENTSTPAVLHGQKKKAWGGKNVGPKKQTAPLPLEKPKAIKGGTSGIANPKL